MYSFRGTISMEYGDSNQPPMTWTQCVNRCIQNNRCILAVTNTYFKCVLFEIEKFDKFNLNYNYEIDPTTPNYMAIKLINTTPSQCSGVNSKDCAEKCSTDANCIMSFGNSSNICFLYSVGDLIKVQTNGEGSDNKIGLKVQNNFTKCAKSPSELLLSAPSVYRNPPIKSYKFSADTPTSYTINYEYDFVDGCSDWLDPVPKCTNCPKAMMSFRGVPKLVNPIAPSSKSWKECMYECYKDSYCYMAYMKNYPDCRMAYYGNVDNVIRIETPPTSSTALHFAAIKYVTDDITCTLNFTSLWTAGRPMKSETSASNYSAYQPTTSGLSSRFSWIGKNSGCIPGFTEKIAGVSGCVRLVLFNNLTVNRSAAIAGCYKYGTYGLMTISSSEALSVFRKAMTTISRQAGTYHIGLSRKTATSAWQWDFPELEIDKSGIVLFAYLDITSTTAVLISSSASQTVDGQFCYVPS
ncbi:Protein CBG07187 [Caenorhabditis briggsae]|uniref:Protein CBG07187 n=1 Tax=Caenorhabditis briggsae TaxID=6238 RepID=A8X3I5_CAEBR|nr:Protein CBG07187 [Caenorhabditis briggsae]CAP27195.2 Protein CBG07187 [Caenorhabditis briggsae]